MAKSQSIEEKQITVENIDVHYRVAEVNFSQSGSSQTSEGQSRQILILHGWGSSSDSWKEVQRMLANEGYRVIVPDMPGFGKTSAPPGIWGVEEYADFVNEFTKTLGIETFILIGHSFGGQTAIQFALTHPEKISKLILVASAGVRRTPGFAKKLVMAVAKIASFLLYLVPFEEFRLNVRNFLYMAIRRKDYVKAQGMMRDVFKKVITQDLTAKFSHILLPTLILWGDHDELVPVQDAYLMKECMPQAELKIFPGAKHALNFEMPERVSESILDFLRR